MKVIGVSGYARCGKDTFVEIAKDILSKNGYRPLRVAFADILKEEVQSMLEDNNFKLDVYTADTAAKNKIRPLMVWWGCARRDLSDGGLYWVNMVEEYLTSLKSSYIDNGEATDKIVVLVSDTRFPNEGKWIHDKWQGQVIHLKRFTIADVRDGYGDWVSGKIFDKAPNEEEAKQDPLVQEMADVKVEWQSRDIPNGGAVINDEYLRVKVLDALNSTSFFKHQTNGILSL